MVSDSTSLTYETEDCLVRDLSKHVTTGIGTIRFEKVAYEFSYSTGWTDLVGMGQSNFLHAIEAKLQKWREALNQARKNRCFAHYCYVALPASAAKPALSQKYEFQRFGVGLIVVSAEGARIVIRPKRNSPLLPWLTQEAVATLSGDPE